MSKTRKQNFVDLTLAKLRITQSELASLLKVSPSQISKWKNKNDYMSSEQEQKFREILELGDHDIEVVNLTGSVENKQKWERVFSYIAEHHAEDNDTGFPCDMLCDFDDWLISDKTVNALDSMGVTFPKKFPKQLEVLLLRDHNAEITDNEFFDLLNAEEKAHENKYFKLVNEIYYSLANINAFHTAYVSELEYSISELESTFELEIVDNLLFLAAAKTEPDEAFAKDFKSFRFKWLNKYRNWTQTLKRKALQHGLPIQTELTDLVSEHYQELGSRAEMVSFGYNDSKIHPDFYMNELVTGMRIIHQVLPKIVEKLDIKLQLDQGDLGANLFPESTTNVSRPKKKTFFISKNEPNP
ncbi:MAG: XRE family transcriptional regulator [Candidatus Puniceispirillaceae bacterium]